MKNNQLEMFQNFNYSREDGNYSIWDHQNFITELKLPANYKPLVKLNAVLEEMYSWTEQLSQERLTVLKVIGDAVCANEDQLRRYLSSVMSYSATSAHITFLRKKGFVQRYKCFLDTLVDENGERSNLRNPAPINLGPAGYTLLSYLYSGSFFMPPDAWIGQNTDASIQRFVAMNEIRCCFAENGIAKKWRWYPTIGGQRRYKKPLVVMELGEDTEDEDSRAWFIFERAQLKQNFLGFFKDRLNLYRNLFEENNHIAISETPNDGQKIVILSCSTVNIAKVIQEEIGLHKYPFPVWVLIDEWFDTGRPITEAFAAPQQTGTTYELKRLKLNI
ncbi:hypothetical protein ACIQYL_20995 [Lysinibacillus xylanilyticus]|uniref:hypothetical protein n=1 Tax=Lysinibacillus xylanilyticus TaxID=582475 RepID=UPI0037F30954